MRTKDIRCETCQWFHPLLHANIDGKNGGCHYDPPKGWGGFPLVSKNDWCRHWHDNELEFPQGVAKDGEYGSTQQSI